MIGEKQKMAQRTTISISKDTKRELIGLMGYLQCINERVFSFNETIQKLLDNCNIQEDIRLNNSRYPDSQIVVTKEVLNTIKPLKKDFNFIFQFNGKTNDNRIKFTYDDLIRILIREYKASYGYVSS